MTIGDNIKKYRKINKITQTELATKLNKSLRTIQKYESDDVTPSIQTLKSITEILNVQLDQLTISDTELYITMKGYDSSEECTQDKVVKMPIIKKSWNELEPQTLLHDKLDAKQMELIYISRINDLKNTIDNQNNIIKHLENLVESQNNILKSFGGECDGE